MIQTLSVCCVFLSVLSLSSAANYTYSGDHGPEHWDTLYATSCNGQSQSPIDIIPDDVEVTTSLNSLTFTGYGADAHSDALTISNNGHTVQVSMGQKTARLSNGGLPAVYILQQLHFHWGANGNEGSEHEIDGKQYPAEVHFVHYNEDYLDVNGTLNGTLTAGKNDVAAVVGVFLEEGDTEHAGFKVIVDAFGDIADPISNVELAKLDVSTLLPSTKSEFYRYQGGLTTPNCDEIVVWNVMHNTITVSKEQLEALRTKIHKQALGDNNESDVLLKKNFRPPQALNGRKVKASFDAVSARGMASRAGINMAAILLPALTLLH